LTPAAIESVLADFRSWLQQLTGTTPAAQPTEHQTPPIDLHTLLGQFLALRHDVNLQTKAARSQQELTGQALQRLDQALEALRLAQPLTQQGESEAVRPLLKTLLDIYDAFSLAEREIRRVQETILPLVDELAFDSVPLEADRNDGKSDLAIPLQPEPEPTAEPKPSWWQRWFGRRDTRQGMFEQHRQGLLAQREQYQWLLTRQQEHHEKVEQVWERLDQLIDSILTGYRMSLQRLERALQHSGLEPISCIGQPFDPEEMEVVAAVADTGRPVGEVIEQVRRGYRWRGRVFRYAQVSVAKS
jgi:molecular chaperone GrpE